MCLVFGVKNCIYSTNLCGIVCIALESLTNLFKFFIVSAYIKIVSEDSLE